MKLHEIVLNQTLSNQGPTRASTGAASHSSFQHFYGLREKCIRFKLGAVDPWVVPRTQHYCNNILLGIDVNELTVDAFGGEGAVLSWNFCILDL